MKPSDIRINDLFSCYPNYVNDLFESAEFPWEVLPEIGKFIYEIYQECLNNGFTEYQEGVLVGKGTIISETACICAPAIIGADCEIRHSAYLRGNVIIGDGCVVGNSSEIKNSVILNHAQIPHYNYVGDSIIGNYAHMGAGAICSNFKGDKSLVTVKTDPAINTGLQKFGAVLADHAEIGCGCVLNPGTVIGKNTRVYPLTSVRGVIPADSIVKTMSIIVPIE